jgi:hypothetical protein
MCAARAVWGAWLPQIYKSKGKEGESFTSTLSARRPLLLASAPEHRVPLRFRLAFASSPRSFADRNGAPAGNHGVGSAPVEPLDGDGVGLDELINGSQLAPNVEGQPPAWIAPPAADREPNPPFGYVVSFVWHHEHAFAAPASRFMCGLCYQYGVELHNFPLPPTRFRKRPPSLASARDSGSTSSARSCTRSLRTRHGCGGRCAPAACRSRCRSRAGSSTSPAR